MICRARVSAGSSGAVGVGLAAGGASPPAAPQSSTALTIAQRQPRMDCSSTFPARSERWARQSARKCPYGGISPPLRGLHSIFSSPQTPASKMLPSPTRPVRFTFVVLLALPIVCGAPPAGARFRAQSGDQPEPTSPIVLTFASGDQASAALTVASRSPARRLAPCRRASIAGAMQQSSTCLLELFAKAFVARPLQRELQAAPSLLPGFRKKSASQPHAALLNWSGLDAA